MKLDTTLTHVDYAALEHAANRLRNEEFANFVVWLGSAISRAATGLITLLRQRAPRSPALQSR